MECLILAPTEMQRTSYRWQLEDLGEDWRCAGAGLCEQAVQLLRQRRIDAAVLLPGPESDALISLLHTRPMLSPPYLLGLGQAAPDGQLPLLSLLPQWLQARKKAGQLPVLCSLRLPEITRLAHGMLQAVGISPRLRAWAFLPDMTALTAVHPPLLTDLQHGLYPLIARRHGMTAGAVERSLRLCVESTWSHGSLAALERFFGHSVDPERGKPTNREFLCRVQERLVFASERLERGRS